MHNRTISYNQAEGLSVHQDCSAIIYMAKNTNVETLCDRELLEKIFSIVERQEKLPPPAHEGGHRLYDNKSLMEKLNIKEKYLKKLRDNGYLGYSREGDKYWYTQEDVDRFSASFPL